MNKFWKKNRTHLKGALPRSEEADRLRQMRCEFCVPIREPLVLISQIQRSGGTLLSQLFDGHPQCHAHPSELHTGYPRKNTWPQLDLKETPKNWFQILYEKDSGEKFRESYSKHSKGSDEQGETHPFLFWPHLQEELFLDAVRHTQVTSSRDIFNCYMTSYFNAWIDNQNLYVPHKKYVTAFAATLNMRPQSVEGFFDCYGDGHFISIVRNPNSWFASARKHSPDRYGDVEKAIGLWKESTQAAVEIKRSHEENSCIVSFEDLLSRTPDVMRALAIRLGIHFTPSLLIPTFNTIPIKADSSFKVETHGVIQEPLERYKKQLSSQELDYISQQTRDLCEEAQTLKLMPVEEEKEGSCVS
jgi:hypothetical protein